MAGFVGREDDRVQRNVVLRNVGGGKKGERSVKKGERSVSNYCDRVPLYIDSSRQQP